MKFVKPENSVIDKPARWAFCFEVPQFHSWLILTISVKG